MLGYVSVEKLSDKASFRKCTTTVKKCMDNCKNIDIQLYENFDLTKTKHLKKIQKIFKKEKVDSIIFQKDVIKKYKPIIDSTYTNDVNIVTGNILYTNMVGNIIKYIFELAKNVKIEEIHLGIAMDLLSYNKLQFIKQMANSVRGITILTTLPAKFENLCQEMLSEYGIVIKCSDNFKSGLKECDVCVNFDLDNSSIIGSVKNKCIYINCNAEITKIKKSFKGIVINDILLDINDLNVQNVELSRFRTVAIAQVYDIDNVNRKILSCIGINGNIANEEFENFRIFKNKK